MLAYAGEKRHLPASLSDLPTSFAGDKLSFTCPADGKPYTYYPYGLRTPAELRTKMANKDGSPMEGNLLILVDADAVHEVTQRLTDGTKSWSVKKKVRYGIVMAPPRPPQAIKMYVIPVEQGFGHVSEGTEAGKRQYDPRDFAGRGVLVIFDFRFFDLATPHRGARPMHVRAADLVYNPALSLMRDAASGIPVAEAAMQGVRMARHVIVLIPGDGIGPEVSAAARKVIDAAGKGCGLELEWVTMPAGEAAIKTDGDTLPEKTLEAVVRHKVGLKGPVGTPVGKGFRSVNVTLRKKLDLYAAVRPVRSMPNVKTRYENVDIVIFRGEHRGALHRDRK